MMQTDNSKPSLGSSNLHAALGLSQRNAMYCWPLLGFSPFVSGPPTNQEASQQVSTEPWTLNTQPAERNNNKPHSGQSNGRRVDPTSDQSGKEGLAVYYQPGK
eukprot:CAMPEP_0116867088 /NCGR_PEP_ID=MMETSP0418-20121206/26417_1 /TAXON_ID=1158023 /ORGANISM="Astrosyne radiata, Strain 13vi08-1A" /LENGTH=102 /DNA_ID=CAMNT_0004502849 /DNA_START=513 /DNA_END=821 /DNA_ORIENTATION=+